MKKTIAWMLAALIALAAAGCTTEAAGRESLPSSGAEDAMPGEQESLPDDTAGSTDSNFMDTTPVQGAMINDDMYIFRELYWLNDDEILVEQYSDEDTEASRIIKYNIEDGTEQLLFEWHSRVFNGGLFPTDTGFRVYTIDSVHELDRNGALVGTTPFLNRDEILMSVNGDYAARIRDGATYILSADGAEKKIFDNNPHLRYEPARWSQDGKYLAVIKNVPLDESSDYWLLPQEVIVVDVQGTVVASYPMKEHTFTNWIAGTHELVIMDQGDDGPQPFIVMDVDTGKTLTSFKRTKDERMRYNIGMPGHLITVKSIPPTDENTDKIEDEVEWECEAYLLNFDGGREYLGTLPRYAGGFHFSPDGKHLAIAIGVEHDIIIATYP